MGVIDAGPFDNDQAGAFGRELEQADPSQRLVLVRYALEELLSSDANDKDSADRLQPRAVAAAAVVGSYRQGGPPVGAMDPPEFLEDPPDLVESVGSEEAARDLVELAVRALDRIAASNTTWAEFFNRQGTLEVFRYSLTD